MGNFYWDNNKAHVHKLASLFLHSTSHCLQCLWGLRIMDDWKGERKQWAVCVCVWRGKHVGRVVEKSLPDCWSTVEGGLPDSTPPGLSDPHLCLCVWLLVHNLRLLLRAFTLSVCTPVCVLPHACVPFVSATCTCLLCVCCTCVGGKQMKTTPASHSMWSEPHPCHYI